jgi:O-acetyl-ADP-ribose deacetylase (regulator of RNase III)
MKTIKGDLIQLAKAGEFDVIVHGCNCFNTMGSGIAAQIKKEFPSAYKADLKTPKGDKNKLGSFTYASYMEEYNFLIVNAYTQFDYSRNKPFDYDAFETFLFSFESFLKLHFESNGFSSKCWKMRVGFPRIGCGLAGGDWETVSGILTSFSERHNDFINVTVVEL